MVNINRIPMTLKIADDSFTAYNKNVLMWFRLMFSPQTIFYFPNNELLACSNEDWLIIIKKLTRLLEENSNSTVYCEISGELDSFQHCHISVTEIWI